MTMKGMKHTAESKARISDGQKRAWAKLKADAEQKAIDCAVPRCKRTLWQSLIALVMGGK